MDRCFRFQAGSAWNSKWPPPDTWDTDSLDLRARRTNRAADPRTSSCGRPRVHTGRRRRKPTSSFVPHRPGTDGVASDARACSRVDGEIKPAIRVAGTVPRKELETSTVTSEEH